MYTDCKEKDHSREKLIYCHIMITEW